jgi:hypothetical protein
MIVVRDSVYFVFKGEILMSNIRDVQYILEVITDLYDASEGTAFPQLSEGAFNAAVELIAEKTNVNRMKELADYIREKMFEDTAIKLASYVKDMQDQGYLRRNREEIEMYMTDGVEDSIENGVYDEIPAICIEDAKIIVELVLEKLALEQRV